MLRLIICPYLLTNLIAVRIEDRILGEIEKTCCGDEWLLCLDVGCTGGQNDDIRNESVTNGKMTLTTRMMMLTVDIITGDC